MIRSLLFFLLLGFCAQALSVECQIETQNQVEPALKNAIQADFCRRINEKADHNLKLATDTYKRLHNVNTLPFPYTWRLHQVTKTAFIFSNTEIRALPEPAQYLIAVSRDSVSRNTKIKQGNNLFLLADHFGYIDTVTIKNDRGFDVAVQRYDAIYLLEKSEINSILNDCQKQHNIQILRYTINH